MVVTEAFPGRGCRAILVILRVTDLDDDLIRQHFVDNLTDIDFVTGSDPTSLRAIVRTAGRGC